MLSFLWTTSDFGIFGKNPRFSICTQLNEKISNLNNWQAVIKQTIDAKAKIARKTLLLTQESEAHCLHSNRPLNDEQFKNQKNFKTKKNDFFSLTNNNSGNKS